MIIVSIYIKDSLGNYNRIELFKDEKISITSSIQNVNDISKTFTDFSQSFSVPASKNNNKLFKHWYENSNDNGFDVRKRVDSYIELDTIPFRTGKLQLESVDLKNNKPDSYKLTFFGSLVSLKDTFNGLLLKDLTLNKDYDFAYTPDYVKDKVTTYPADRNIMFPLITSDKVWTYGTGTTYDISNSETPILYSDLFPAIKLDSVFKMIESQFGINFNVNVTSSYSPFLIDPKFTAAYLWLKNAEKFILKYAAEGISFNSVGGDIYGFVVNLDDNLNPTFSGDGSFCTYEASNIKITSTVAGLIYNIHTFKNDVEILKQTAISIVGDQTFGLTDFAFGGYNPNDVYKIKISAPTPITFNAVITLFMVIYVPEEYGGNMTYSTVLSKSSNQTTSASILPVKDYFPEMKIEDFLSGILKQFNLTCYSTEKNIYNIETIEDFYASGNVIDISKYIITDTQSINRVKSFNKIKFEHEKSENLISANFLSANSRSFGDLYQDFDSDGSEYNIKLPFECYAFNQLSGNLIAGYALKTDLKNYIPKPVILYNVFPSGGTSAGTFYFRGSTTNAYTDYNCFGNETIINNVYHSLVWGAENSFLTSTIPISLYTNYYQSYLQNIFDEKARLIKLKSILPLSIITTLRLKDRVIIRDKRYIINSMNIDLITGETQLELLTDFR